MRTENKYFSPGTSQSGVSASVLGAAHGHGVIVIVQVNVGQVVLETVKLGLLLLGLSVLPLGMDRLGNILQVSETLGILRFTLRYLYLQRTNSRFLAVECLAEENIRIIFFQILSLPY